MLKYFKIESFDPSFFFHHQAQNAYISLILFASYTCILCIPFLILSFLLFLPI